MPTEQSLLKLDKMLRGLRDLHNPETTTGDVHHFARQHMADADELLTTFRGMRKALMDIYMEKDFIPSHGRGHGTPEDWWQTTGLYEKALERKRAIAKAALYGQEDQSIEHVREEQVCEHLLLLPSSGICIRCGAGTKPPYDANGSPVEE